MKKRKLFSLIFIMTLLFGMSTIAYADEVKVQSGIESKGIYKYVDAASNKEVIINGYYIEDNKTNVTALKYVASGKRQVKSEIEKAGVTVAQDTTDIEGVAIPTFQNLADAITAIGTKISSGKNNIASAITTAGVSASGSDTWQELADKISQIQKKPEPKNATPSSNTYCAVYSFWSEDEQVSTIDTAGYTKMVITLSADIVETFRTNEYFYGAQNTLQVNGVTLGSQIPSGTHTYTVDVTGLATSTIRLYTHNSCMHYSDDEEAEREWNVLSLKNVMLYAE